MTLERKGDRPNEVRLVECPFCAADLSVGQGAGRGSVAADHLEDCEAFESAWRDDPQTDADALRRSEPADFGHGESTGVQDL